MLVARRPGTRRAGRGASDAGRRLRGVDRRAAWPCRHVEIAGLRRPGQRRRSTAARTILERLRAGYERSARRSESAGGLPLRQPGDGAAARPKHLRAEAPTRRRSSTSKTSTCRRTARGARSSWRSCCSRSRRWPTRRTRTARARPRPSPTCSGSRPAAARPRPIWASRPSRWPFGACRAIVGGSTVARAGRHHALHAAPADAAAVPARHDPDLRDGGDPPGAT